MIYKNGIGYSSKTGALYMSNGVATYGSQDGASFKAPDETLIDFSSAIWSRWGTNNVLPLEMADHIENVGVLSSALDAQSRIAMGKGFMPFLLTNVSADGTEELEWVSDSEILDWLELNDLYSFGKESIYDKLAYGWSTGSFILSKDRKNINRVFRRDVSNVRLQKMDGKKTINSIIECTNWLLASASFNNKKMIQIPALLEGYELSDLQERGTGYEFAFINRSTRQTRIYYPLPLWYSARHWVKVARSVPAFKNAMFNNQITLKYVISISDKYWESIYGTAWQDESTYDQVKKKKLMEEKYDEIDMWLTGEENSYKTLSSGSYYDPLTQKEVPFITITVIDDKVQDGKHLPESSAANSEILFALMMNPALIGAGQPGGPYSNNAGGSNIRESYLTQMMISEAERKDVGSVLNLVKNYNGWAKRLETSRMTVTGSGTLATKRTFTPRLVFRCVSNFMTTLDTGKNTKNTTM